MSLQTKLDTSKPCAESHQIVYSKTPTKEIRDIYNQIKSKVTCTHLRTVLICPQIMLQNSRGRDQKVTGKQLIATSLSNSKTNRQCSFYQLDISLQNLAIWVAIPWWTALSVQFHQASLSRRVKEDIKPLQNGHLMGPFMVLAFLTNIEAHLWQHSWAHGSMRT